MRKAITTLAAGLLVACASGAVAGDNTVYSKTLTLTSTATNAATAVEVSTTAVRGKILEVIVDFATSSSGTVAVAIDPDPSTSTDIAVYTKALVADTVVAPVRQEVGNTGTGVGTYAPFLIVGGSLKVTGSLFDDTNVVTYVTINYEK